MRAAVVVAFVVGCGGSPELAVDAGATDADQTPVPPFPSMISVGASTGSIDVPFTVTANGMGALPLGPVALTADVGIFEDGHAAKAFVYMTVPFSGFTLYQGFAVSPTSWDVFWLYCMGAGINNIYDEGVSGPPMFDVTASGTCAGTSTATTAQIALDAVQLATPAPFAGYSVHGSSIFVREDGAGSITLAGHEMPLLVFGDVDCSACGGGGWFELHSVIWDDANARAIFVIIYLMNDDMFSVELTYARSLPDLADPIGDMMLPATWTTVAHFAATRPRTFGVPPPSRR